MSDNNQEYLNSQTDYQPSQSNVAPPTYNFTQGTYDDNEDDGEYDEYDDNEVDPVLNNYDKTTSANIDNTIANVNEDWFTQPQTQHNYQNDTQTQPQTQHNYDDHLRNTDRMPFKQESFKTNTNMSAFDEDENNQDDDEDIDIMTNEYHDDDDAQTQLPDEMDEESKPMMMANDHMMQDEMDTMVHHDDDDDDIMDIIDDDEDENGWDGVDLSHEMAPISQADSWTVISKYFEANGLVRQQIASFDEFVRNTIQEIVEDTGEIYAISGPQRSPDDGRDYRTKIKIEFAQVYITPPTRVGDSCQEEPLLPSACRLRQFTYCAEVECEIRRTISEVDDESMVESVISRDESMVPIGRIPVMVRSMLCTLTAQRDSSNWNPSAFGECPFDGGGYFIINGREKVLVAQERMAANHVMCYLGQDKRWMAEIRSSVERSNRCVVANYVRCAASSAFSSER
eukprot:422540_1